MSLLPPSVRPTDRPSVRAVSAQVASSRWGAWGAKLIPTGRGVTRCRRPLLRGEDRSGCGETSPRREAGGQRLVRLARLSEGAVGLSSTLRIRSIHPAGVAVVFGGGGGD